jgi:hypothetical protein
MIVRNLGIRIVKDKKEFIINQNSSDSKLNESALQSIKLASFE